MKFKTRPSCHKLFRARHKGKEGREVVKGQFQPHAVVTDPRRPTTLPPPPRPPPRPRRSRILFLSPPATRRTEPQFDTDAPFEFRIQSAGADLRRLDSAKLRVVRKLMAGLGGGDAHTFGTMCVRELFYESCRHMFVKSP